MTYNNEMRIAKAMEKLKEARMLLDAVMYASNPPLNEEEYKKCRKCYDKICEANDVY